MRVELVYVGILLFILGFSVSSMFGEVQKRTAFGGIIDRDNPSDSIFKEDIHLYDDKLIIEKTGLSYAPVADTKSMEPLLSSNSHVIETDVDFSELAAGDIISFYKNGQIIVHSITEIGQDSLGKYALTKGYNNEYVDDWKVRASELKGKVIGVLN